MFVCTKCYKGLTRFEKAKKNVEGIKGRSAVFISPLKTIKQKVKRQRVDQLVGQVENVAHAPKHIATTKRVSTAKSLKFTDISCNISVSSTLTRSTRLKAKLDKIILKQLCIASRQIDENIAISRHKFFDCSHLIGFLTRSFERRAHHAGSSHKIGQVLSPL